MDDISKSSTAMYSTSEAYRENYRRIFSNNKSYGDDIGNKSEHSKNSSGRSDKEQEEAQKEEENQTS